MSRDTRCCELRVFSRQATVSFSHEGTAFYWYGHYIPSPELPQTCIILSSHPDWPFDGNVFTNGTVPNAALFGCRQGWLCQGTKCVEQLSHFKLSNDNVS